MADIDTIKPVADDIAQAEKEVAAIIAAYKSNGASGVAALLPALAPELQKDYADIKAAIPTIKAGYKTTEFWIVVAVCLGMSIMTMFGKVPTVDGATIVGALTGIYTMVRGLTKNAAVAATPAA